MGLNVSVQNIENPRKEKEEHYYNPKKTGLIDLGLKPTFLSEDVISSMLEQVMRYKNQIDKKKIMPRVKWN